VVTSDVRGQTAVHSLDQGRFDALIKAAMFGALIISVSLLCLFVHFRGLLTAGAMDEAQIATAFVPLSIDGQCIMFSDRPRWNQSRTTMP
jgi:hypothetical protein